DTEAPLFDSGLLGSDGQTLVLAFSEAVVADSDDDEDWVLTASGGAAAIAYESGSGTSELTYSASRVIEATETLSLAYTQPGGGVHDSAGNDLASFSGQAVTNNSTEDLTAPSVTTAIIANDGLSFALSFDEDVTLGSGDSTGLSLSLSGGEVSPTYDALGSSATVLVWDLDRAVEQDETGTYAYTNPGNGIEDLAGNDLANVTDG